MASCCLAAWPPGRLALSLAVLVFLVGCVGRRPPAAPLGPTFSTYVDERLEPSSVRRVLLLPLANESPYAEAGEEVQAALAAELQATGCFEVIRLPRDAAPAASQRVRLFGQFDERELVDLARKYQVNAVLFGTVTEYRVYSLLALGLSLQLVSTDESVVLASVEGHWDARDAGVAAQARAYCDVLSVDQTALDCELVLSSPHLYQRFVCYEAARVLSRSFRQTAIAGAVPTPDQGNPALVPSDVKPVSKDEKPQASDTPSGPSGNDQGSQ